MVPDECKSITILQVIQISIYYKYNGIQMMENNFSTKEEARQAVWDEMVSEKVALFPFPPHGRIPNFKGAEPAAKRLFEIPALQKAKRIKVNPDSPQRYVRELALQKGMEVYMPMPRLRAGFNKLDPKRIPSDRHSEAAKLSKSKKWSVEVKLSDLLQIDFIITGSVAVTCTGRRCGKGEGYGDLEYAILRELGQSPLPVATTVHPIQIVDNFPLEPNDVPLSWIVTPFDTIWIEEPPPPPTGIDWKKLTDEDLNEMPVLRELNNLRGRASGMHSGLERPNEFT